MLFGTLLRFIKLIYIFYIIYISYVFQTTRPTVRNSIVVSKFSQVVFDGLSFILS